MRKVLVILDNGHGVNTKGKCSPDGRLREWAWTREFVRLLNNELRKRGIMTHILVPEESDVSLSNRCLRANTVAKNYKAIGYDSILVSIHNNAASSDGKWHDASGFTVWVYTKASKNSRKLAKSLSKEADLLDLTGNRWIPESGIFEANYYILKNTDMPAVLTENMFQDNKEDVDFLLSEAGKKKLLELHVNAILEYLQ